MCIPFFKRQSERVPITTAHSLDMLREKLASENNNSDFSNVIEPVHRFPSVPDDNPNDSINHILNTNFENNQSVSSSC